MEKIPQFELTKETKAQDLNKEGEQQEENESEKEPSLTQEVLDTLERQKESYEEALREGGVALKNSYGREFAEGQVKDLERRIELIKNINPEDLGLIYNSVFRTVAWREEAKARGIVRKKTEKKES